MSFLQIFMFCCSFNDREWFLIFFKKFIFYGRRSYSSFRSVLLVYGPHSYSFFLIDRSFRTIIRMSIISLPMFAFVNSPFGMVL